MPSFYYPEGYFGPICDSAVSDEDIAFRSRRAAPADPQDDRVIVYPSNGKPEEPWWEELSRVFGFTPNFLIGIRCKQRSDGSYYDCVYDFADGSSPVIPKSPYDPDILKGNFTVPNLGPESCSPADPDINIRPQTFYDADGVPTVKYKRERSSPVTFAVDAGPKFGVLQTQINATWNSAGTALVVTGTGSANVELTLEWDDNPNTYGVAVDSISITDDFGTAITWTRSGEEGSETNAVYVSAGTYNVTFVGLNSANNPIDVQSNSLCLKDSDNDDCNATFRIDSIANPEYTEAFQWNTDGREYGVWVNPEVCTLPGDPQNVTYFIDIEDSGTYGFTFGADDRGTVVLNETDTLFNDVPGGIFEDGAYKTPYTVTRSLTRGRIRVDVTCLNAVLQYAGADSYDWNENPGGWFLKICKGGPCVSDTNIANWMFSGTAQQWSDFMNTYAVFPSNTDPLVGVAQTATWNIDVPDTDDYTLEVQADNNATITLDGSSVATSTSFTSSTTVTLSNLSVGAHTIGATVTNNALGGTNVDSWANNPAGVAWTITRPASTTTENIATTTSAPNAITARFSNSGDIIVEGEGSGTIQLIFEWDDNPDTNGTALGQIKVAGKTFTQTTGVEKGNDSHSFIASAGQTISTTIIDNPSGFSTNNNRICFRDSGGSDCNAKLTIAAVRNSGSFNKTTIEQVTTTIEEEIIATSLDLSTFAVDSNNLIWHTRKAVGYEYYTQ